MEWRGEGSGQEARRGGEERKKQRGRGRRDRHTHTVKTKMSGGRKSGRKAAKAVNYQKHFLAAGESLW